MDRIPSNSEARTILMNMSIQAVRYLHWPPALSTENCLLLLNSAHDPAANVVPDGSESSTLATAISTRRLSV